MNKPLDMLTPDRNGFIPNRDLIGREFQHAGNGHSYTIIGYAWFGDTDEWAVIHKRTKGGEDLPHFTRSAANFFGQRTAPRYTRLA